MPKMVSHYREAGKQGRKGAGKMEARRASLGSSGLQKGQREKQSWAFQGAGMGGQAPGGTGQAGGREAPNAPPPPPQALKWRLAAAAAGLCPGMGWGWRAGRAPSQMPPGWARWLPAGSADPTSPSPEPSHLELWGWRNMGAPQKSEVQRTKPGPPSPWAGPQDPTKMARPGTAQVTGWGKNKLGPPRGS